MNQETDGEAFSTKRDGLALTWVVLGALLFLAVLEASQPYTFFWDDNSTYFLPSYVHNARTLATQGELALINPHQYLGQLHLAHGQTGVLYPPIYLAVLASWSLFGDARITIDLLAIAHLLIAAAGMFVFLRSWKIHRVIAAGVALVWITWPFPVQTSRNWVWMSYLAAFLPWNLWLVERLWQRPTGRRVLFTAGFKAIAIFSGYIQGPVLMAIFEAMYLGVSAAVRGPENTRPWRSAGAWIGCQLASVALAAPMLLPMLHAKSLSVVRSEKLPYEAVINLSLDPWIFLRAQVFSWKEAVVFGTSSAVFFVGIPLLIALAALILRPDRRRFLAAGVVALLTFIASTRAYGWTYFIPILGTFRWPFKSFLFFLFFLALPIAGALDGLWVTKRRGRRLVAGSLLVLGLASNVALAFIPTTHQPFSLLRIEGGVEALHRDMARLDGLPQGRVASIRCQSGLIQRYLSFNYATLVGKLHHSGYEPLVAKENHRLSGGEGYTACLSWDLDERKVAYLGNWAVRYLFAPDDEQLHEELKLLPQLRLLSVQDEIALVENIRAAPLAEMLDPAADTVEPLELDWGGSSYRIVTRGRAGLLRVRVAPLPWMHVELDGETAGAPIINDARQLLVPIPPGTRTVEIRHESIPFRAGVGLAATLCLAVLAVAGRRRMQGSRGPAPEDVEQV